MRDILRALVLLAVVVLVLAFTRWMYEATMASDLPDWLKYFLLR